MKVLILVLFSVSTLANDDFVTLNWPPYVEANGPSGPFITIVNKAIKELGSDSKIVIRPWARAIKETKSGDHIGLFPEYYSREREKDFYYSKPLMQSPVGLYVKESQRKKLKNNEHVFKTKRLGLVKDYINTKRIDEDKSIRKSYAVDDLMNIMKLCQDRVDAIFIDYKVAEYLIKKYPFSTCEGLTPLSRPLEYKNLHVIFPKSHPKSKEVWKAFNKRVKDL